MKTSSSFYKHYGSTTLTLLVCVSFLFILSILQKKHDDASPPFSTIIKLVHRDLLPAKILPHIDFGFTKVLADFYWLRSIQDFVAWDGKDDYFLNYFKNISALDPTFEYPYLFSILVIPQMHGIASLEKKALPGDLLTLDKIAPIAARGIESIPTSWKIPYYLGTQYYLYTKTYVEAEKYLKIAAGVKGAPDGVYLNYASFVTNNIKGYRASHELIKVIRDNTDSDIFKKITGEGMLASSIGQMLEKGILAYKTKFKKYPKTVEDLLAQRYILLPEGFLNDYAVIINQYNGSFEVKERR